MELTLDGRICELGADSCAVPGCGTACLADPEACGEGRKLTLTIPVSSRNDAVLGFARDPHAAGRFNASRHRAELSAEGAVLMAGSVRLLRASSEGYALEIRADAAQWARTAALRMLDALAVDFRSRLDPAAICAGWSGDAPVKFFPVRRDAYASQSGPQDLLPAERILTTDDYHPFLHIATLVGRIFSEAGYRIRSRFLDSAFFRSLYMSGAYASRDTAAADERMGFRARRSSAATASADSSGRVYADPYRTSCTVGDIVDTAAAGSVDADGEAIEGLYNRGGCFARVDGAVRFTPPAAVAVGFEYALKYTTDHRIRSRTRLTGFDRIYLGPGSEIDCTLANRYEDRRPAIAANRSYRIVVFAHAAGASYRLLYTRDGAAGVLWSEFAARTAVVTTPASGAVADPVLQLRSGASWVDFDGDWALYDGHVGETGRTTVTVRVRTASQPVSPASPARFDGIYFAGAEAGMKLTLDKECWLQPLFFAGPGCGSVVAFADVARHRIRQSTLLAALAHLFNLRFHTDEPAREVWIEPADDFFDGPEVDWTGRTDFSQPVCLADLACGVHERRTWRYRAGDGAVTRFEAETGSPFGAWSHATGSFAALEGEAVASNPLFSPSLCAEGCCPEAPAARVLLVGDRDAAGAEGAAVTPRIVRYAGLHPLPGNERWGPPWNRNSYPLAAFHFAGDASEPGFTLCFEDRDGLPGLHRYYDRQLARESVRQRITLSLRIAPHEFEALLIPGDGVPNIRSRFRIDTGAGVVRALLERIDAYDPEAPSVRCVFVRLAED